ncbi:MAG TPA: hypothetical protein DCY07_06765, partial [Rhodospirillaceae bacterium]|nr:hypothetical protein [Rhodospirillaceae bacterium]
MDNVIEFNEFTISSNGGQVEAFCWLCQKGTSLRALFCQHCGTIQPVRALDHFARLGLERRIDVDSELLERQYASYKRTLAPEPRCVYRMHIAAQAVRNRHRSGALVPNAQNDPKPERAGSCRNVGRKG